MAEWLFANSRDLMLVLDGRGRLELVNPAWAEAVGVAEDDALGRPLRDFVHPEDVPPGSGIDEAEERHIRLRRADGAWAWFAARVQGASDGRLIVCLRNAESLREQLWASAGVGLWSFEPDENRVRWPPDLLRRIGVDPVKYSSIKEFRQLMPAAVRRKIARQVRLGVTQGRASQVEHPIRTPTGEVTFRVSFGAEPRPGGKFALVGVAKDITEFAAARDAARRGEQRMRQARREALANGRRLKLALEVAQAGAYEIDHVAKTFWASPEFMRLAGRPGRHSYAAATELRYPRFHPDDVDHVRECFRALHCGERAAADGFEARVLDSKGNARWVRIFHHLQVARNGRWLKAVGMLHDIDADKRQEIALITAQHAAEAAADAKACFLANMSHEIRTPMNGVLGVLHLLKAETLSDEGRRLLEEALSCGQMLAQLLNDVIDFSKIEAGQLDLACEPVDPGALAEGVLQMLRPQAAAKGLRLVAEPEGEVGWVRADPIRLRQALFNLLGNAVKFTEQGGVTLRFRQPAPGRLRFEVEDTGVGIPEPAQQFVFDRFNQGDVSTTRRFGGSGLGLTITRGLAQMMGGEVGFSSVEGQGSTFWLEIDAEAAAAQAAPPVASEEVLSGLRILVVEDNPTNRTIATKLLEQLGASVETAADGYLGVEAASQGEFDLILMDVQMPGIDGLEAAQRIRALGPPISDTPIIALTANVLAHQREAYLAAGMDAVVGKPISPAALLQAIAVLGGAPDSADRAA